MKQGLSDIPNPKAPHEFWVLRHPGQVVLVAVRCIVGVDTAAPREFSVLCRAASNSIQQTGRDLFRVGQSRAGGEGR